MKKIEVENNIKIAETLPSSFYKSEVLFDELKEKVFYKSWQLIDHESVLPVKHLKSLLSYLINTKGSLM